MPHVVQLSLMHFELCRHNHCQRCHCGFPTNRCPPHLGQSSQGRHCTSKCHAIPHALIPHALIPHATHASCALPVQAQPVSAMPQRASHKRMLISPGAVSTEQALHNTGCGACHRPTLLKQEQCSKQGLTIKTLTWVRYMSDLCTESAFIAKSIIHLYTAIYICTFVFESYVCLLV